MSPDPTKAERVAIGVICLRASDQAFLLLRHSRGGHLGVPKGHRDENDLSELSCALRELREETGVQSVALIPSFRRDMHYEVEDKKGRRLPKRVTLFLGLWPEDTEPRLSEEHSEHIWLRRTELGAQALFENLRATLEEALDHFAAVTS